MLFRSKSSKPDQLSAGRQHFHSIDEIELDFSEIERMLFFGPRTPQLTLAQAAFGQRSQWPAEHRRGWWRRNLSNCGVARQIGGAPAVGATYDPRLRTLQAYIKGPSRLVHPEVRMRRSAEYSPQRGTDSGALLLEPIARSNRVTRRPPEGERPIRAHARYPARDGNVQLGFFPTAVVNPVRKTVIRPLSRSPQLNV